MALVSRAAAPLGSFKKTGAVRFAAELGLILVAVRAIARARNAAHPELFQPASEQKPRCNTDMSGPSPCHKRTIFA